mgnify:CR=1 FL=1
MVFKLKNSFKRLLAAMLNSLLAVAAGLWSQHERKAMREKEDHTNNISLIDKWFIPDHARDSLWSLRKARTLVSIHLFLFFIAAIFQFANTFIFDDMETPPLSIAMLVAVLLILIFRRWGNFNLSGNLLAFFLFVVMFLTTFDTGGLYSDNLLWMVVAPLLALLFANVRSGFFWLAALQGCAFYLFILDAKSGGVYREQTLQFDSLYYYTTYAGLFIILVGIVLIFATGQAMIIKAIFEKQVELAKQKAELARQAQSLREAEAKLLASNKELEQFAYAASHDLKEPLRMIGSYTQLIKRKIAPQDDKATVEYMGYVTDGVGRMERLLNDLLEYSRLGRRNGNEKEISLDDILLMVVGNLTATMKDADAAIYANPLPTVKASSTEMMQLFQNLISNSIKFRKKEVNPIIDINCSTENGHYVIKLHDNGIGIPAEHRESVFNIFERLHSRHEYEGTGIGLATCKKIVNNLGGNIWVEQEETCGTTFVFTLPRQ